MENREHDTLFFLFSKKIKCRFQKNRANPLSGSHETVVHGCPSYPILSLLFQKEVLEDPVHLFFFLL